MRLLLVFLAIQAGIAVLLCAIWLGFPKSDRFQQDFMFVTWDMIDRLEQHPEGPRVILFGGSSFGFSASAKELTEELGMTTLNLGFHARFGFEKLWQTVRPHLDPARDTIVLSPEYLQFATLSGRTDIFCNALYLRRAPAFDLDSLACLPDAMQRSLWDVLYYVLKRPHPRDTYFRDTFNEYGDATWHYDRPRRSFDKTAGFIDVGADKRGEFLDFVRSEIIGSGFRVVYVPVFIPRASCFDLSAILRFQNEMAAALGSPGVEDTAELCYPDEWFFDTWYHMTRQGVERRTAFLAQRIRQALPAGR